MEHVNRQVLFTTGASEVGAPSGSTNIDEKVNSGNVEKQFTKQNIVKPLPVENNAVKQRYKQFSFHSIVSPLPVTHYGESSVVSWRAALENMQVRPERDEEFLEMVWIVECVDIVLGFSLNFSTQPTADSVK